MKEKLPEIAFSQDTMDAARTGSVRKVLLSLLYERPVGCSYHGLKALMLRLAKAVPQFSIPSSKADLERILKSVADYKPPGVYRLKDTHLNTALGSQLGPKDSVLSANTVDGNYYHDAGKTRKAAPDGPMPNSGFLKETTEKGNSSVSHGQPPSSSSRGFEDIEEGWVLHHINRKTDCSLNLVTHEDYEMALAEYGRKYEAYFCLHQLLSANRRDFEALQLDLDLATSEEDKKRIGEEIAILWTRRFERSKQWESAFRRLHDEVAAWKSKLEGCRSISDLE